MSDTRQMSEHVDEAAKLLVNYLEGIGRKAGFVWQSDYSIEVRAAVEEIVEAAGERARQEYERLTTIYNLEVRDKYLVLEGRIAALEQRTGVGSAHQRGVDELRAKGGA